MWVSENLGDWFVSYICLRSGKREDMTLTFNTFKIVNSEEKGKISAPCITRSSGDKGGSDTETESEDIAEGGFAWEERSDRDVEEL